MTTSKASTSGISKVPQLPSVIAYPPVHKLDDVAKHFRNKLCYILRHYVNDGIAVVIKRIPKLNQVFVKFGDWKGNEIDMAKLGATAHYQAVANFMTNDIGLFVKTMSLIKLEQAQFFMSFTDDLTLVDIQLAINKFVSPGMLKELFGRNYKIPEVIKIEQFDDRVIEYINKNSGSYQGDLIVKPSKFSLFNLAPNKPVPLIAERVLR